MKKNPDKANPVYKTSDIYTLSYKVFGWLSIKTKKHFGDLKVSILKSGLKVSVEAYVSFLYLSTILSFILSASLIYYILYYILHYKTILAMILLGIPFSILVSALTFAGVYSYPSLKAMSWATRIEDDLPYAITHMSVLATAGATPEKIIKEISRVPNDAVAEFMKDVNRDIELLGMDIVTAIRRAKERAPSRVLADFLGEFESVLTTGGNIKEFLNSYTRQILTGREIKVKEFSETLATLAEVYIILMVVFPLLLIIMLSIMSLVGGSIMGLGFVQLMSLITYIVVPIVGIIFIILLDQLIPRGE